MTAMPFSFPIFRAFTTTGTMGPLAGGLLHTFEAGTSTPLAVYQDAALTTPHTNPVVLDSNGQATIYLGPNAYKMRLEDSTGSVQPGWPIDGLQKDTDTLKADLAASSGSSLVGFIQSDSGAVSRTVQDKGRESKSLLDFGAKGDGSTDDTIAFQSACASGAFIVTKGVYIVSSVAIANNVRMIGFGEGVSVIRQKASTNADLFSSVTDVSIHCEGIEFDGNGANQTVNNFQDGFGVAIGSLILDRCYLHDFKWNVIRTGNAEQGVWDINAYAHDVVITNCKIEQRALALGYGDCLRIFRTKRGYFANNKITGGLSGMRTQDYCDDLVFINNDVRDSHGDVGITVTLSTNIKITGNTCIGHWHHGIEANSCKNVVVCDNVCNGNGVDPVGGGNGLHIEYYVPPVDAGGNHYSGYWDGLLVESTTSPTLLNNVDYVVQGNILKGNGKFGIQIGSTNGCDISGNTISSNNVVDNPAWNAGVYLAAGLGLKDNVNIHDNTFIGSATQTIGIIRVGAQNTRNTIIRDNKYVSTSLPFSGVPALGGKQAMSDVYLADAASVASGATSIVADAKSCTGSARSINDTGGGARTTVNFTIKPVNRYGAKLVCMRLRTPDTMTACTVAVTVWKTTQTGTLLAPTALTLTSEWLDFAFDVTDAHGVSYDYDEIQVQVKTDLDLGGNINIERLECWLPCDA